MSAHDRGELRRRSALLGLSAVTAALVLPRTAAADLVKSGTVDIEQVQIAFLASGHLGGGTLHFGGKNYPFSVGGLGIGGIGVSKMQAHGEVYDLKRIEHFPGAYGQARTGVTVGDRGKGELWLQNSHGVVMKLASRRQGLALSIGADAVYIDFK